ncbi:MAG: MerR family transcriptional regulator [Nitrospira sp. SB0672_bin_25]|nr:MerR family transcriptional regulator [Nitrospira sp. SB0666_bin_27]MYF25501.1 MerR family transcriptional regulator [Nitrospira sp. SB0678_bin_10]MYJ54632.1 MerR family transcriptional regulator [Nitrospira sp. SB0672_bin_25]
MYRPGDPALLALGKPQTLAHWRSQGRGPVFVKLGAAVGYCGKDLNAWLTTRRVETKTR